MRRTKDRVQSGKRLERNTDSEMGERKQDMEREREQ